MTIGFQSETYCAESQREIKGPTISRNYLAPLPKLHTSNEQLCKQLHSEKAPGMDGIPEEPQKTQNIGLVTRLHRLINTIWPDKTIPEEKIIVFERGVLRRMLAPVKVPLSALK